MDGGNLNGTVIDLFFNCDKSHGQPLYHVNIKEFCERLKYKLLFH